MLPALQNIRVLDFCRMLPGDLATVKLADLGADVIKVEHPRRSDYLRLMPPLVNGTSLWYLALNRNKRSLQLDYQTDEGREILEAMLASADVLVEVSRPGGRLVEWLDYEIVSEINPQLIYCSITGFGQAGPYSEFPSHGFNIDGAAGVLHIQRQKVTCEDGAVVELPEVEWISVDGVCPGTTGITEGASAAALAILAALIHRQSTGVGQFLDISCWDAAVAALGTAIDGAHTLQFGHRYPRESPLGPKYNAYCASDGGVMLIAPMEPWFWERFSQAVGHPEWVEEWAGESIVSPGTAATLRIEIAQALGALPRDEWLRRFAELKLPVTPLDALDDVLGSEQIDRREMLVETSHPSYGALTLLGSAIKSSAGTFSIKFPPPLLGDHSDQVLQQLGYSSDRIADLRARHVVGGEPFVFA